MGFEWLTLLELGGLTGDADQGGWAADLSFYNNQDAAPNYRRLDLYHRNFSGQTWEITDRIGVKGVIVPSTITADRAASRVSAQSYTYHKPLGDIPVTGCYFEDPVGAPAHAHQINNLSLALVLQHLMTYHVSIYGDTFNLSQIDTAGSTAVDPYVVRENSSLWAAMQRIAQDEFYVLYWNRQNQLVYKAHPQFDAPLPGSVDTLDSNNLAAPYQVEYRTSRKARNVVVLGLTNTGQVLESTYPAGAGVDVQGPRYEVRCNAQARLNTLAQRQFEWLNRDYTATLLLGGAWDVELWDRVQVTLSGTTTNGVSFSWTAKNFWARRVSYLRRAGSFGWITELVLEEGYS